MHYHVLGGLWGYLPNFSIKLDTLEEARTCLKDMVESEFDAWAQQDISEEEAEARVTYSQDLTYASIKQGGNEYYEIVSCEETDCLGE